MYVLVVFATHRPTLIFIWTFGVIFPTFFMIVIGIITLIFCSSVNHTMVILKYLNPTSSNNLTLRPTLLLRLNCRYKTAHATMGTKVPGNERSWKRKFPGTFVPPRTKEPGNESSTEFRNQRSRGRKFSGTFVGTKVLHRDLSFLGTKGLGYEKSVIRFAYRYIYTVSQKRPTFGLL